MKITTAESNSDMELFTQQTFCFSPHRSCERQWDASNDSQWPVTGAVLGCWGLKAFCCTPHTDPWTACSPTCLLYVSDQSTCVNTIRELPGRPDAASIWRLLHLPAGGGQSYGGRRGAGGGGGASKRGRVAGGRGGCCSTDPSLWYRKGGGFAAIAFRYLFWSVLHFFYGLYLWTNLWSMHI